jgi:hypothetical protein
MNDGNVTTLLKQAAPEPAREDFADLEAILRRGRTLRTRRLVGRAIGGVAVSLVVVAGGMSLAHIQSSGGHSETLGTPSSRFTALRPPRSYGGFTVPGVGRELIELFDPSRDLLIGGRVVSVDEASRLVPDQMYLARDAALPSPEVWVLRYITEDGTPSYDAAVRYDSSVVITFATWPNGRDPATAYQEMQSEWDTGYVTTIGGNPAWVVPAGSPHTVDPRISVVDISIGDVEISFLGRVPVDDLIQYASTLRPV